MTDQLSPSSSPIHSQISLERDLDRLTDTDQSLTVLGKNDIRFLCRLWGKENRCQEARPLDPWVPFKW